MTEDPDLDPKTWVLRNRLGISERTALRAAEDLIVSARLAEIDSIDLPDAYGWPLLSAIHRHLFRDVYDWAGALRTVGIEKNGDAFVPPGLLDDELDAFEQLLATSPPPRSIAEFVPRFARLYERLNHIHPFREGNGRAQRAFWELYLREYGLELAWSPDDKVENDHACAEGSRGRFTPLEILLGRIVRSGS